MVMYDAKSLSVLKIKNLIKDEKKTKRLSGTSIHIPGLLGGGLRLKSPFGTLWKLKSKILQIPLTIFHNDLTRRKKKSGRK
jgi:hypothetical protein